MNTSIEMFDAIATDYDAFKQHRRYNEEAAYLIHLMEQATVYPSDASVLDLGMATGSLLLSLSAQVGAVAGLDASEHMRVAASQKLGKQAEIYDGSFEDYDLNSQFDVILWMDGGVGYVHPDSLDESFVTASKHLAPGGILIIEPWYNPDNWEYGKIYTVNGVIGNRQYVRQSISQSDGTILFEHFVYENGKLLKTMKGESRFFLHAEQDLCAAIEHANFEARKLESALFKRGLIVASLQ